MKVEVKLLALPTKSRGRVEIEWPDEEPLTIVKVMGILAEKFGQEFKNQLLDSQNRVKQPYVVLLNEKGISDEDYLGILLRNGDRLSIFPPMGGG